MVDHDYSADYVIIGAGAAGLAFADVMLTESDYSVLLIDRYTRSGGHWNFAYPFVRLHQPSSFYGVPSRRLGQNRIDDSGYNAGFFELATSTEVLQYYDDLLREQFEPTGRFTYLPLHEYLDDGTVKNVVSGKTLSVHARRKVVDARYLGSVVPSMREHHRSFTSDDSVAVVTPNQLCDLERTYPGYVILGAGKTSADTAVWLLNAGVDPERITWVRPRDAWFFNRAIVQPGAQFARASFGGFASRLEAASVASDASDLARRFEEAGVFLRIDTSCEPSFFRGATLSQHEIDMLRSISRVVRQGYLRHIDASEMVFHTETVPMAQGQLYIDCTAEGLRGRAPTAVFSPTRTTIQYVVNAGQATFSAALVAMVELCFETDEERNANLQPAPITGRMNDVACNLLTELENQTMWSKNRRLRRWIDDCRLNPSHEALKTMDPHDTELMNIAARVLNNLEPAMTNLRSIVARQNAVLD